MNKEPLSLSLSVVNSIAIVILIAYWLTPNRIEPTHKMGTEVFANRCSSTLSQVQHASDAGVSDTLVLANETCFPDGGTSRIIIDNEYEELLGIEAGVMSVVRGTENSTAAAHNIGALATLIVTNASLQAIEAQILDAAATAAASTSTTVIFQPGNGQETPPIYGTAADLAAFVNTHGGTPITISTDTLYTGDTIAVPAETWNFPIPGETKFDGFYDNVSGLYPTLNFADGTYFRILGAITWRYINASFSNTSSIVFIPSIGGYTGGDWLLDNATLINTGTQRVVSVVGGGTQATTVELIGVSSLSSSGAPFFVFAVPGVTNTFSVYDGATLGAGSFALFSGATVTINAAPGAIIDPSFIGMSGVTINYTGNASQVFYISDAGYWDGGVPTSVTNALDRIAKQLGGVK